MIGSVAAVGLVGRRRVAPTFLASTVLCGVPLLGLAVAATVGTAMAVFVACGIGLALSEIAGQTLLQRVTPDELIARVYGCVEGFRMGAFALGSIACSVLFDSAPVAVAVGIVAVAVTLAVAAVARPLAIVDRESVPPPAELIETLQATHFLVPLPAVALERSCNSARRVEPEPGEQVVAYGEWGASMFVIAAGEAIVERHGRAGRRRPPQRRRARRRRPGWSTSCRSRRSCSLPPAIARRIAPHLRRRRPSRSGTGLTPRRSLSDAHDDQSVTRRAITP